MRRSIALLGSLASFTCVADDCPVELTARLREASTEEIEFVVVNRGSSPIEVSDHEFPWEDPNRLLVALVPKQGDAIQRLYAGGDAFFPERVALLPQQPVSGVISIGSMFITVGVPELPAAILFWHWTMELSPDRSCAFGGWVDVPPQPR